MSLAAQGLTLAGRLAGVSADLRAGEVTAICGPNGAGKSSLLACLAGLVTPDGGQVLLDGRAVAALKPRQRARSIGFLPQTPEVAWDVTVETLVSLGRLPWPGTPGDRAITAALAAMDLESLRQRPVSRLSGGERARALLARVLAGERGWLLADEPLANLDLAHAASLMRALRHQAASARGVVLVLHDLAMAMNHAHRVLVLSGGELVADGSPAEALSPERIARIWGVQARWLGAPGQQALAIAD
ncbi:MAG TPA: ABC transporter ATP-binding protein [Novosphingobium sp.]|nr:ABC transporter ATP-binding protein [Novosphingobium sp.]